MPLMLVQETQEHLAKDGLGESRPLPQCDQVHDET